MQIIYPLVFLVVLIALLYFLIRNFAGTLRKFTKETKLSPVDRKIRELSRNRNLTTKEKQMALHQFLREREAQRVAANAKKAKAAAIKLDEPIPAIALRRLLRHDEQAWSAATSWLGGLPRMSTGRWPIHSDRHPAYYCIAQIDLASLPDGPWRSFMPASGALVFFADIIERGGKVIYEPDPGQCEIQQPPVGLEPLETGQRALRRWPVELIRIDSWNSPSGLGEKAERKLEEYYRETLGIPSGSVHIDLPDEPGETRNRTEQEQVKNLLAGSRAEYDSLDKAYAEAVMSRNRVPFDGRRHQLFGAGDVYQFHDEQYPDHQLLLQVSSDHMLHIFGDSTAVQFWIRPEDLRKNHWADCVVTVY